MAGLGSGRFQINDIVLDIPPEQIHIERRSTNFSWPTLRTRSSTKLKSGFSEINITCTCKFTDMEGHYKKLTDLVSQFRVTPFCYVENTFLRDALLAGDRTQKMALAMRQMEISKDAGDVNVVTVTFMFSWFNYLPYLKNYTFKADIFEPAEAKGGPQRSTAWKRLYEAEKERGNYIPIVSLQSTEGKDTTLLTFTQFALLKIEQYGKNMYKKFKEELTFFKDLEDDLKENPFKGKTGSQLKEFVKEALGKQFNTNEAAEIMSELNNAGTSMFAGDKNSEGTHQELIQLLQGVLGERSLRHYSVLRKDGMWAPVVLRDGSFLKIKDSFVGDPGQKRPAVSEDTIILERERKFPLADAGLIVTGISISFENILATLPMIGHPYPTFQHIGSVDAVVTISMMTTDNESVQALSNFYSVVEDQSLKYKRIPQGQKNIKVFNPLVSGCGLKEFLAAGLVIDTVPGQPGTYAARLTLVDNPVSSATREEITQGGGFSTTNDIRNAISEVLIANLSLIEDATKEGWFDTFVAKEIKDVGNEYELQGLDRINPIKAFWELSPGQREKRKKANKQARNDGATGYYRYTPVGESTNGPKDQAFKSLCVDYGERLGQLWANLLGAMQNDKDSLASMLLYGGSEMLHDVFSSSTRNPITQMMALQNRQVYGIEKVQEDLMTIAFALLDKNLLPETAHLGFKGPGVPTLPEQARAHKQRHKENLLAKYRELKMTASEENKDKLRVMEEGLVELNDRMGQFMNDHVSSWLVWSRNFLDKIMLSGQVLLPQFEDVKVMMETRADSSGGAAYPDFPMRQIVENLDDKLRAQLKEQSNAKSLYLHNVGDEVLINPDFYFYNPQTDGAKGILENSVIEEAQRAILEGQEERRSVEKDWVKGSYMADIVGLDRYKQSLEDMKDKGRDELFWEAAKGNEDVTRDLTGEVFAPDDLQGILYPSIKAATEEKGKNAPVTLQPINSTLDKDHHILNTREEQNPNFQDYHCECFHNLSESSIAGVSPQTVEPLMVTIDPNKAPEFSWPVPPECQNVTSKFTWPGNRPSPTWVSNWVKRQKGYSGGMPRTAYNELKRQGKLEALRIAGEVANGTRIKKKGEKTSAYPHKGIDYALFVKKPGGAAGQPVTPCAPGHITKVKPSSGKSGGGNMIFIKHSGGFRSVYMHLQSDGYFEGTQRRFAIGNREVAAETRVGSVGTSGGSTGPHLHFEIYKGETPLNPEDALKGAYNKLQGPTMTFDAQNESLLTKSVAQFKKDIMTGQGYSMIRAYPAFKLYFIESDMNERKRFGFDDFFGYSAVKDITVIRSRKIAADLCMFELTNVSGALSNRKFQNAIAPVGKEGTEVKEGPHDTGKANTLKENPVTSMLLQPGVQIQLRLGYNNNPKELETVFNGVITDLAFSESDDVVSVTCQSFAIELTHNVHGESKTYGGFLSSGGRTANLLEELLAYPEVVHFGRWEAGDAPTKHYRYLITNKYTPVPSPQDDNIFAPTGRGWKGIWDSTPKYTMYNTTIWDVFQEMTLRHPAYVTSTVPYTDRGGNPRMTMFFGVPDQLYMARDPTFRENNITEQLQEKAKDSKKAVETDRTPMENLVEGKPVEKGFFAEIVEVVSTGIQKFKKGFEMSLARKQYLDSMLSTYALNQGIVKPFRSYHLLTSSLHIMHNSISSSSYGAFNTVTLQYGDDPAEVDDETMTIKVDDPETLTVRCDQGLPDDKVVELFASYPNCVGYEMAKRYCVSLLQKSLKEGYKGSVLIIGNEKIKPHDICYIFDEYTDMFGPVEVEQVVHRFSQRDGFVTEVTPDMVIHVNQLSTLSTSDAMGLVAERTIKDIKMASLPAIHESSGKAAKLGSEIARGAMEAGWAGVETYVNLSNAITSFAFAPLANMLFNSGEHAIGSNASTNPFAMVGTFIFKKLITRTQFAHPIRYSPLVKGGQAMLGGLPNRYTDGSIIRGIRKWWKEDLIEGGGLFLHDVYDKLDPSSWFGHSQGSFVSYYRGTEY